MMRVCIIPHYDWTFECVAMNTAASSSGALWETQLNPVTSTVSHSFQKQTQSEKKIQTNVEMNHFLFFKLHIGAHHLHPLHHQSLVSRLSVHQQTETHQEAITQKLRVLISVMKQQKSFCRLLIRSSVFNKSVVLKTGHFLFLRDVFLSLYPETRTNQTRCEKIETFQSLKDLKQVEENENGKNSRRVDFES